MQKLNCPLKSYIKAVETIAEENGFSNVKYQETKGSIVRFELFEQDLKIPSSFWTVHYAHNDRKKPIWSKEDYRKAAVRLRVTLEDFIKKVESV